MPIAQLGTHRALGYRHPLRPHEFVTSFSVDVVDGNGTDVPGLPVIARFSLSDGETRDVHTVTDSHGRARFVTGHDSEPISVEILAARETTGPTTPAPGARLVIET
jgi:hypothetical protein